MTIRSSAAPSFRSASHVGVLAEIGRELREARQARGEDLYDVADYLRIKPSYLFALEDGDHSLLPGNVYALGFLRSYGEYLGLDGQRLVDRARVAVQQGPRVQPTAAATSIATAAASRRSSSGVGLIVASVALVAVVYAGWFSFVRRDTTLVEQLGALPAQVAESTSRIFDRTEPAEPATATGIIPPAPPTVATAPQQPPMDATAAEAATPPIAELRDASPPITVQPDVAALEAAPQQGDDPLEPAAAPSVQTSAVAAPVAPDRVGDAALPTASLVVPLPEPVVELAPELRPAVVADPAVADPAAVVPQAGPGTAGELLASLVEPEAAPGSVAPAAPAPSRLAIRAVEASWVQIRSADRSYLRTRMLEPGERMDLPDRADLALWTGNAGGIRVVVDGAEFGPIGESGAVVKNVPIAADELRSRVRN